MRALPLSGSESRYTNRRWSTPKGIGNNNCYAYAVGDYEAYRWQKSIPGDRSGLSNGNHNIPIVLVSLVALFQTTQKGLQGGCE
jgi:hypothetical protein